MPTLTFEDSQIKAIEKFEKQFAPEIESFEIGKSQTNSKVSGVADVAEDEKENISTSFYYCCDLEKKICNDAFLSCIVLKTKMIILTSVLWS